MRDNLISFIKEFVHSQNGTTNRNEILLGSKDEIQLKFGYGYHSPSKVLVYTGSGDNSAMHLATIEDAVDEFMKFYKLV